MRGRIASLIAVLLVAGVLGGCAKCDFAWFDAPRACHSDAPK
jgi:Flp pilus assembly pilin Flp